MRNIFSGPGWLLSGSGAGGRGRFFQRDVAEGCVAMSSICLCNSQNVCYLRPLMRLVVEWRVTDCHVSLASAKPEIPQRNPAVRFGGLLRAGATAQPCH